MTSMLETLVSFQYAHLNEATGMKSSHIQCLWDGNNNGSYSGGTGLFDESIELVGS